MNDTDGTEVIESAKAVQETAKATSNAVDLARDAGSFFNRVFGDLVEDGVGIVADKVKYYRKVRAIDLAVKTEAILEARGIKEDTKSVPPKIAVPLIENATLEDNDELHDLWATLLANAMDPSSPDEVVATYISILKELRPIDVAILKMAYEEYRIRLSDMPLSSVLFSQSYLKPLSKDGDVIEKALLNLMRLGCIKPGVERQWQTVVMGDDRKGFGPENNSYGGTDIFQLSVLSVDLIKAVSNPS